MIVEVFRPGKRDWRQPYTGINALSLWLAVVDHGFAAPIWMTYRQASELGALPEAGEGRTVIRASAVRRSRRR